MDDLGDVGDFEKPDIAAAVSQFLISAHRWVKANGELPIMNMFLMDDPDAIREMVKEGNIDEEEAELWALANRLDLFFLAIDILREDEVMETPSDFPYYAAVDMDGSASVVFMKDKRLAKVIDWSYY